jgi:XRE family transcriptional regulator, regulator of sulfur utilization
MKTTPELTPEQLERAYAVMFSGYQHIVGERIKSWRLHHNWTLKELAQRTGLSVSYLSDIERGRNSANLTLKTAYRLAIVLRVEIGELLDEQTWNDEEAE